MEASTKDPGSPLCRAIRSSWKKPYMSAVNIEMLSSEGADPIQWILTDGEEDNSLGR